MFKHNLFILVLGVCVAVLLIFSFKLTGNPADQKAILLDQTRYSYLSSLKSNIEYYFSTNADLPDTLKSLPTFNAVNDPFTKKPYVYNKLDSIKYELCTEFAFDTTVKGNMDLFKSTVATSYNPLPFAHKKGYDCLQLTIPDSFKNASNSYLFEPQAPTPIPLMVGNWSLNSLKEVPGITISNVQLVKGKFGNAASFAGSKNSYIQIFDKSINNITKDFTLSLWTYRLDADSRVIATTTNNNDGGFGIYVGNKGEVYCRTSNGHSYVDSYTDYNHGYVTADNQWHYVAIVKKNNRCLVYVDGEDVTLIKGNHNIMTNYNPLTIGGDPDHTNLAYKGYVDEVKLYNYALTADQIRSEFQATPSN